MKLSLPFLLSAFLAVDVVAAEETQHLRRLAEKAYIVCGDEQRFCTPETTVLAAFVGESHEVRCCADVKVNNKFKKKNGCDIWAASELESADSPGEKICHHSATFLEAEAICQYNGARLCTQDEMLSRCTVGTGCGHDEDHIWTSTRAPPGDTPAPSAAPTMPPPLAAGTKVYLACGDRIGSGCNSESEGSLLVVEPTELHEVRCCSDKPLDGWRKWSSCSVWGQSSDLIGLDGIQGCQKEKTYVEAVDICGRNGARLCTKQEILAQCTAGSGCMLDDEMIWTSTVYDESSIAPAEAPVCAGPSGEIYGDPHVVTFDGLRYDCQGQGEYVVVQSKCKGDPLRIHARFVDGSKSQSGLGTVTRSYAVKVDENVPTFFVSVPDEKSNSEKCPLFFAIGSEDVGIPANEIVDYFKTNFDKHARLYFNGRSIIVTYRASGTRIEIESQNPGNNGCVMRINVCMTLEKHDCPACIVGLTGTPTNDKEDDWTTLSGDVVPIPSPRKGSDFMSSSYDYCRANWCIDKFADSMYYNEDGFNSLNKCTEYTFDSVAIQAKIDALSDSAKAKCESSADPDACLLDTVMDADDGTMTEDDAADNFNANVESALIIHNTTEGDAEAGAGDFISSSQASITSSSSGSDTESTQTSVVRDVEKCLDNDLILMTKEEGDEPLPADTIHITNHTGHSVMFNIIQTWKPSETISWITPVFRKGDIPDFCDCNAKIESVPGGDSEPYEATCEADGTATVVLYVHDGSFKTCAATNEHNCNGWGNDNGIATYHFVLSCTGSTSVCPGNPVPVTTSPTQAPVRTYESSQVCPTPAPTPFPTPVPVTKQPIQEIVVIPTPGSIGDPHFKTWKNEHFEYHGQCDMILVKDEKFADGLGLEVQIRTKLIRFWSYIKSAAIRIGDDILELEGSLQEDKERNYWINLEYQGDLKTLGGFPVTFHCRANFQCRYEVDLSSKYPNQKIELAFFKEFIKVDFQYGTEESYGNTVGMLGDFKTGKTLARDGITELDDFYKLGSEWQVLPSDNMLFHDVEHPQFPQKCIEPEDPRGDRRRRLEESTVSEADAEKACASVADTLDRKDCIYDILATQDLGMVGAY